MFEELRVGGTYPPIAGKRECTYFGFDQSGPVLIYNMYDPTREEINKVGFYLFNGKEFIKSYK